MERENVIHELNEQIVALARLHIQHRLEGTEGFKHHMDRIAGMIHMHKIDIKQELDPLARYFYRRYFD